MTNSSAGCALHAISKPHSSLNSSEIIKSYGIRPVRSPSPDETLSTPGGTDPEPTQSPEAARLQPSTALAVDEPSETACVDVEAPQPFEFGDPPLHAPEPAGFATKPRSGVWLLKASALALAGAALIGAGLGVKTGMPKAPSFVAAPQGPATAAQPSHDIVAAPTVADATPLKDTVQPAPAKTVGSDESPTELSARVSLGNMPESPALASVSANAAQPAKQASTELTAEAPVNLPIVASPAVSQVPDSGAARAASPPPDATPSATASPSATDSTEAPHASNPSPSPAKPAPKAGRETAAVAQPPTPKPVSPTKPSMRSSARLVIAKAEATAPGAAAETREPLPAGASIVVPEAPAEPQATPPSAPSPAGQLVAPMANAFSTIVGALGAHAGSDPQPADQTAAKSDDWGVQFAAPKSEAQAKIDASRLNAKYAPALNGATIGVHKTLVQGETIYALRVAGLSKAEAAALCERVKGRDCFLAK